MFPYVLVEEKGVIVLSVAEGSLQLLEEAISVVTVLEDVICPM